MLRELVTKHKEALSAVNQLSPQCAQLEEEWLLIGSFGDTTHAPLCTRLRSKCAARSSNGARPWIFGTTRYLQNVVARAVAEVPHADLRAHVPAAEGAAGELQATDLQQHVGDRREAVPLQVQVLEPLVPARSKQGK